ncbi:MAG: AAA domain-containing protein [Treponema sp.]|nr:AAA domain-containing protein [Treponema sp.]
MSETKDEAEAKILAVLQNAGEKVNPAAILSKLGWKKDKITEICNLFGVEKFTEVLQQFSEVKIEKDNNGTTYVVFAQNKKAQENKNMPETEKTSENIHDRMEQLLAALNSGLYEKDEAVRLSLLTAVAGESMFLLGAPGCAKSMIARRIAKAFKTDGDNPVHYFEYLMNQFSTPEEVFGNISIKALCGECEDKKEEYRRLTEGFLPTADIAFLDEIWKASPAILNSLLTIINERKFHNGSKVDDVPLKALFSASNELPAKNHGLEALYDRFILRLCVDFIQDEDRFLEMLEQPSSIEFKIPDELKQMLISNDELKAWKTKIDGVSLSEEAKTVISAIRKELTARNEKLDETEKNSGEAFEVGDRRWKKIARILKTSAFLNDRAEVDLMDCSLIEHCIWNTEAQQEKAHEIVSKCIEENGLDCDTAIEDIEEQIEDIEEQIEEFATNVKQTWFEEIKEEEKEVVVEIDNKECYECTRDGTKEIWYVSVNVTARDYYHDYHSIYDSNGDWQRNDEYSINGDAISCYYNFTVNKTPAKTYLKLKNFSTIVHEIMQKNFDKAYYAPIVDKINAEIDSLKQTKETYAVPFKANLFADQDYSKNIMAKLEEAKQQLEDAKDNLDKQRNRYFNAELSAAFSVGDVILKNGIMYSAEEIKNLSEEEKKNVVAVVCIASDKTYAIGITEAKMKWDALQEFCAHYGDNLPKDCASNWIVPDKEQFEAIWKNREAINESLSAIDEKYALTSQEYWSSSLNDAAACYLLFDERGHQDHTTKDHEYAVRAIREWKK